MDRSNLFQVPRLNQNIAQQVQNQFQKIMEERDKVQEDPNLVLAMAMVKSISKLMDDDPKAEDKDKASKEKRDADAEKKTLDEGSKAAASKNPVSNPFMKLNEVLELNPVSDLASEISSRRLLTRSQIQVMNSLLNKVTQDFQAALKTDHSIEEMKSQAAKVQQTLMLSFNALLNTNSFSISRNAIDSSAHSNLAKSALELIKSALQAMADSQTSTTEEIASPEVLQQQVEQLSVSSNHQNRESNPYLFNLTLPVILEVLQTFSSQDSLDQAHLSYLQRTDLKLETTALQSLNPYLKSFVQKIYDQKSVGASDKIQTESLSQKGDQDMIELPQNRATQMISESSSNVNSSSESGLLEDSDLLFKALEFVPIDQKAVEEQINQQLHSKLFKKNLRESSPQIEEERKGQESDEIKFIQKVHNYIANLKINDLLSNALKIFSSLLLNREANNFEFLLMIDPQLIATLVSTSTQQLLQSQQINKLLNEELVQSLNQSLQQLIEAVDEERNEMQIDSNSANLQPAQIFNSKNLNEKQQHILKFTLILSKLLIVLLNIDNKEVQTGLSEFIKTGQDFKFLATLALKDQKFIKELKMPLQSILMSLLRIIASNNFSGTQTIQTQESSLSILFNLDKTVKLLKLIKVPATFFQKESKSAMAISMTVSEEIQSKHENDIKDNVNPFLAQKLASSSGEANASSSKITTRSQMKQKANSSQTSLSQAQDNPSKSHEKQKAKPQQHSKVQSKSRLTAEVVYEAFYFDEFEFVKSLLSLISHVSQSYVGSLVQISQGQPVSIPKNILKGLFDCCISQTSAASRIIHGIATNFTKANVVLSESSLISFQAVITKKLDAILSSNIATSVLIKMLIVQRKQELSELLFKKLMTAQDLWNLKKTTVKSTPDLFSNSSNLRKYVLLLLTLILLPKQAYVTLQEECISQILIPQITAQSNATASTAYFCQNFHFLFLLLNPHNSIESFKPVVFKYLMLQLSDDDNQSQVDKISEEIISLIIKLINEKKLDPAAVQILTSRINFDAFLQIIQSNFLVHFKGEKIQQEKALASLTILNTIYGNANLSTDVLIERLKNGESSLQLYAQLDLTFKDTSENLKVLAEAALIDEGCHQLIQDQLDTMRIIASRLQAQYLEICEEFFELSNEQGGFSKDYLAIIYLFIQNPVSAKVKSILQNILKKNVTPEGKSFVTGLFDHAKFAGYVYSTMKTKEDECIFAHCFSQPSAEQQKFISLSMLMKSLYKNSTKILNSLSQDDKALKTQIAEVLLQYVNAFPILSISEVNFRLNQLLQDSYVQDSSQIDKFLDLVYPTEKVSSGFYGKIKQLGQSIIILNQSSEFLEKYSQQEDLEQSQVECLKNVSVLQYELNSVLSSLSPLSNTFRKDVESEKDGLSRFLALPLNESTKHMHQILPPKTFTETQTTLELIWSLTLKQIGLSFPLSSIISSGNEGDDVKINEKKGGVQITFNFGKESNSDLKQPKGRDSASKPPKKFSRNSANDSASNKNKASNQASLSSASDQVMRDENEPKKVVLDQLANKLINLVCDMIQLEREQKNRTFAVQLKSVILKQQYQENFISQLLRLESIPNLKRFMSILFNQAPINPDQNPIDTIEETSITVALREKFNQMLAGAVRIQEKRDEEFLLNVIDLAMILIDDNLALIKFIQKNVLGLSVLKQSPTKLLILQLLCQLASSKCIKVKEDSLTAENRKLKIQYSIQELSEARKKIQEQKKAKKQGKAAQLSKQLQQNEQALKEIEESAQISKSPSKGADKCIDGYKQDDLVKEDSAASQRFMEKPGDVCTYILTQKNFTNQHWYFCYTCNLTGSSGCCAVCAHRCHKGHAVVYSRKSNFFCDCGDSGRCTSLKPPQQQESKPNDDASSKRIQSRRSKRPDRKEVAQEAPDNKHEHGSGFSFEARPEAAMFASILSRDRDLMSQQVTSEFRQVMGRGFRVFGEPPQVPDPFSSDLRAPRAGAAFLSSYQNIVDEFQDDMHPSEILQQLGIFERPLIENAPPAFAGDNQFRRIHEFNYLSESSEEDYDDEDEDEAAAGDRKVDRMRGLRSMNKIVQIIGGQAAAGLNINSAPYRPKMPRALADSGLFSSNMGELNKAVKFQISDPMLPRRKDSGSSLSMMSAINPLEDPLSESGAVTPLHLSQQYNLAGNEFSVSQDSTVAADIEMEDQDLVNAINDIKDILRAEQSHFDEVFNQLLQSVDLQLQSLQGQSGSVQRLIDTDEVMSSLSSGSSLVGKSLAGPKQAIKLTQDLTSVKRTVKDSFEVKLPEPVKSALKKNLNMIKLAAATSEGLIAVCQNEKDLVLYPSSQFFEDSCATSQNDRFQFEIKEGANVNAIETFSKLGFTPTLLKFNPSCENFLALAGVDKLEVVSVNSQGRVQSKLSVDLMLEILNNDLQIVDVEWLPNSKTMLAVATREFIKIYDLAQDNISPTHTVLVFSGYITDFTFGAPESLDSSKQAAPIYVSTNNGQIYYHQISYFKNSSGQKNEAGPSSDVQMKENEDSQIMMTQLLKLQADQLQVDQLQANANQSCESIYYAPKSNLLLMSFKDGKTLCGRVEGEDKYSGFILDLADDSTQGPVSLKNSYKQNGPVLVNFKEVTQIKTAPKSGDKASPTSGLKTYILAVARKPENLNSSLPLILEISEDFVIVSAIKSSPGASPVPACYGLISTCTSSKVLGHQQRLISFNSIERNAVAFSFVPFQSISSSSSQHDSGEAINFGKLIQQSQMIKKSDLPKNVRLSVNFFEKMKNVFNEPNLRPKLTISGDVVSYFKTSKATFETLSKGSNQPVITENAKKQIKMTLKIDTNTEQLITGLRVRVDQNPKANQGIIFKVFNRSISLKSKFQGVWVDVPLSDAEIIFAHYNSVDCEFSTNAPSECPIKVFGVEVYSTSKKEFHFKEKLKSLESLAQSSSQGQNMNSLPMSSDQLIEQELLQTGQAPLIGWKESSTGFKQAKTAEQVLVHQLNLISNYLDINPGVSPQALDALETKLQVLLKASLLQLSSDPLSSSEAIGKYGQAAIKRCLKKLLAIRHKGSHKLLYQEIKDQIILDQASALFSSPSFKLSLEFQAIRYSLNSLSKILTKRNYQFFKLIQQSPNLVENLVEAYLKSSFVTDKYTTKDVSEMLALLFAKFVDHCNQLLPQFNSSSRSLDEIVVDLNQQNSALQILQPTLDLLLHSGSELIQKATVSLLMKQLEQYASTQQKILLLNMLPTMELPSQSLRQNLSGDQPEQIQAGAMERQQFIVIDPTPSVISYLFNSITTLRDQCDCEYALVFKLIKLYEKNCQSNYAVTSDGSLQQKLLALVSTQIGDFILQTMNEASLSLCNQIYESRNQHKAKYLYLNLVLINLLLQDPHLKLQDSQKQPEQEQPRQTRHRLRMKNTNIQLSSQFQSLIYEHLNTVQNAQVVGKGVVAILKDFEFGFRQGKCSLIQTTDDGIPDEVKDRGSLLQLGQQQNLLRPIQTLSLWKWTPLFQNTESIFEVLDRKIPAQTLLFSKFVAMKQTSIDSSLLDQIVNQIKSISMKNPCKVFLLQLANLVLQSLSTLKLPKELSSSDSRHKLEPALNEFLEIFEPIYHRYLKLKKRMSFSMGFKMHSALRVLMAKAFMDLQSWNHVVASLDDENGGVTSSELIKMLVDSSYVLDEDSASVTLVLAAAAYQSLEDSSFNLKNKYKLQFGQEQNIKPIAETESADQLQPQYKVLKVPAGLDLRRVIKTLLLGKNQSRIRTAAADLLKGIYETQSEAASELVRLLLEELPHVRSKGINSLEFIDLLQSIMNREISQGRMTEETMRGLVKHVYKEVKGSNVALSAHPNLVIYSTLQKMSNVFSRSSGDGNPSADDPAALQKAIAQHAQQKFKKITNPYILESEVCGKCASQKSLPPQVMRLNDLKTESKFTDSTHIYKLNATYTIRQLQMQIHEIKGHKVLKTLTVYVNNKQGIDLADMRNNWSHWRKVSSAEVKVGQKSVLLNFVLPVDATNILIEMTSQTLTKPLTGKEKVVQEEAPQQQNDNILNVTGLDTVLSTLPIDIKNKIGYTSAANQKDQADSLQQLVAPENNQNMNCPRCGKPVQGRHGICNQCGENAMQCSYCRNINYEKPDAYLCNECGFSRFAKFEFTIVAKWGFAAERIENDDQKNSAAQQIENYLKDAQANYQKLMGQRDKIEQAIKIANSGGDTLSYSDAIELYGEVCANFYQQMMRQLNMIKILKNEIELYQNGSAAEEESNFNPVGISVDSAVDQLSCFSCIQENLRGYLQLLKMTAPNLRKLYREQGFVDLLYAENLNVHRLSLENPAKDAICELAGTDADIVSDVMSKIKRDLKLKSETIPSFMLAQNIKSQASMMIKLLQHHEALKDANQEHLYSLIRGGFEEVLAKAIEEGQNNAAIADEVVFQFLNVLKPQGAQKQKLEFFETDILSKGKNSILASCLTMVTSTSVRDAAKEILTNLISSSAELKPVVLEHLLAVISKVVPFQNESLQYFDVLALLLKERVTADLIQKHPVYLQAFEVLFVQIEQELSNLVVQENERVALGIDGLMPQISTGQVLSRLVAQVSAMIKGSQYLTTRMQSNVNLVIKSYLKIRKLNLSRNKLVQDSEVELEKMFKQLHSEQEQDKESFVLECFKIIRSGQCDLTEVRFLLEEVCKVINPVKPVPEYQLNLHKAPSQEVYFRGNMAKNPYLSSQLGKTIGDVRLKICKEMELAEPELVELLVAGKIVSTDLTIVQVYEQVFWPALCKQRDPELYDVPNIDEAPKASLQAMNVIFRLMGIDGEATEDRVETLADADEAENNPQMVEKKYGVTQCLARPLQSGGESGLQVLMDICANMQSMQKNRYLAEWLFKLIQCVIKIKQNRQELLRQKGTVSLLSRRLFESVGVKGQVEGSKGLTLFDFILNILEQLVNELTIMQEKDKQQLMEVDSQQIDEAEATNHVKIFMEIMSNACAEMMENGVSIERTSQKIRAVSKILPFLIADNDQHAVSFIVDYIGASLENLKNLDRKDLKLKFSEKLHIQFNLERSIEMMENCPSQKNFLKDAFTNFNNQQLIRDILRELQNNLLANYEREESLVPNKATIQYLMKFVHGLFKNHPPSQSILNEPGCTLVDTLYGLTQAKHSKDKSFILLAQDLVQTLTNKNLQTETAVAQRLSSLINNQQEEKKKLAQRKREEIMRQMQSKKNANKFVKQVEGVALADMEEQGPKCIVCSEGYTRRPTEVLGMYVFSKKAKITEVVQAQGHTQFVNGNGYITVTHSNYIHFLCHDNARKADQSLKQPKKEWEGAVIRNDHTKCNNLFPLRGGSLPEEAYFQMVEKYFQLQQKAVGSCDSDKTKVCLHDLKVLLKRLSYEESFSRDSHGGGPEHNMHLLPFLLQMTHYLLKFTKLHNLTASHALSLSGLQTAEYKTSFKQEKTLVEFLEQANSKQQSSDFLNRLEEEKKMEADYEEEEKFEPMELSDSNSLKADQEEDEEDKSVGELSQANQLKLDQIAYMLTLSLVFSQAAVWESHHKAKFLSLVLSTVASMKEDKGATQVIKATGQQTDYASGMKVLSISKQSEEADVQMADAETQPRRRRLSSDNKIEVVQRSLLRLRPLLIHLRLIDILKQNWDVRRLALSLDLSQIIPQDKYLEKLNAELLSKGNLQQVIAECDEVFRVYKERVVKIASVEEFMEELGLRETIVKEFGSVEAYVMSHF